MEKLNVVELTKEELISIDGGKPLTYYLGKAAGTIVGTFISFIAGLKDGLTGDDKND